MRTYLLSPARCRARAASELFLHAALAAQRRRVTGRTPAALRAAGTPADRSRRLRVDHARAVQAKIVAHRPACPLARPETAPQLGNTIWRVRRRTFDAVSAPPTDCFAQLSQHQICTHTLEANACLTARCLTRVSQRAPMDERSAAGSHYPAGPAADDGGSDKCVK